MPQGQYTYFRSGRWPTERSVLCQCRTDSTGGKIGERVESCRAGYQSHPRLPPIAEALCAELIVMVEAAEYRYRDDVAAGRRTGLVRPRFRNLLA